MCGGGAAECLWDKTIQSTWVYMDILFDIIKISLAGRALITQTTIYSNTIRIYVVFYYCK